MVAMIAIAMGTIIIAVAVFDIHIERNAVAIMNPKMSMRELEPALLRIISAIRSCKPQRCMDIAMIKPPRKRKITLSAYGAVASAAFNTPRAGKRTIGKRAVA